MSRKKKGAPPHRGSSGTRGGRGSQGTFRGRQHSGPSRPVYTDFGENSATHHIGFTLADEARHTSQHDHSTWSQLSNLRQRPVIFVSAGFSEPLKQLDRILEDSQDRSPTPPPPVTCSPRLPEQSLGVLRQDAAPKQGQSLPVDNTAPVDMAITLPSKEITSQGTLEDKMVTGPDVLETSIKLPPPREENDVFFIDVVGTPVGKQARPDAVTIPDRPSSRSSSSSEEVILFKGRDIRANPPRTSTTTTTTTTTVIDMIHLQDEISVLEKQIASSSKTNFERESRGKMVTKKGKYKQKNRTTTSDEEDAILADYIANMKEDSDSDDANSTDAPLQDSETIPRVVSKTKAHNNGHEDKDTSDDELGDESESELNGEIVAKAFSRRELGGAEDVDVGASSSDEIEEDRHDNKLASTDDFDPMDWERPSLRRKTGKGAKARIEFNVSDSELEQSLQVAWNNDRMKKSQRKKQREELRALGQLGMKPNPDDLRIKYPDGIKMDEVAAEIELFLISNAEILILPPMDNHARKTIHDFANKFKIKSKSTGKGDQRRPTLYRTLRTLPYNEAVFHQAVGRINRRHFPRLDMKGKRARLPQPSRSNDAAATYRDGEVVGATAPELGAQNRGRAMLEKMGWNHGTALGVDNTGILQPVTHTMKRSKAGLG